MTKSASLAKTIGKEAAVGSLGPLILTMIWVHRYSRRKALHWLRRVAATVEDAVLVMAGELDEIRRPISWDEVLVWVMEFLATDNLT